MEVIFDTNAYREFYEVYLKSKPEEERLAIMERLRNCEINNGIRPSLNLFVLAELIKHLADKGDPSYDRCLNAIWVTFQHTNRNESVSYIPPPEIEVCRESFGKLPSSMENFLSKLGALYSKILELPLEQNYSELQPAFIEVAQWINKYKQSFIDTFSGYLNNTDPLNANNWRIYPGKENKNKRQKYIEHLRKEDRKLELAIGLYLFIDQHLDFRVEWTEEDFFKSAEELKNRRTMGFSLMLEILEKFSNGDGYDLSKGNNPNDVIDFVFALSLDSSKNRILVSGDKDLHRAAAKTGLSNSVMTLENYLRYIGFI